MSAHRIPILLTILASGMFAAAQATAKLSMLDLPLQQVLGAGNLVAFLLTLGGILVRRNYGVLLPKRPAMTSLRMGTGLVETWCTFHALKLLPLPTFTTLTSVWPLFTLPLASLFLKEKLTARHVLLTLVGFGGIVIAAQPDETGSHAGMIYALSAALGASLGVIVLRSIGTSEKIETLVLYTLGAVGIVNLVLLPRWIQPTETQCLMLLVIGMLFYAGNLVITRAIQLAPASLIAPLRYTTFIWASGFGWYFFAKLPDMWTIAGIVLIAMSGILLARKPA